MNIVQLLKILIPIFVDFIEFVVNSGDKEFEKVSSAWPTPTRTKLARIRSTLKAQEKFIGGGNGNG